MTSEKFTIEKYTCRVCGYEWMQRPIVKRDKSGLKIGKVTLTKPQNCSNCKSRRWNGSRF